MKKNELLSDKLKTILHYLDEHYTENISLDQLAEHFFISKYYLSREFKKEFGTTVIQYVLAKRINNAKELLRYSNSSIEEIAHLCGIDDASYFNKVFRKMEGCTASEYRKRW
ncbi:helix-turn-helix transcriptional regulator [Roseburia intestinalis]|uniref:helix-turn-helix transcriptional regulator n=1 Tax=Roseburia intestinalis TaxID=166486 RepID=UPI0001CD7DDA|nr:AraC family transcriptional regulator [Roseburia intestinalis]CBL08058.1 AraC-type DNA-binding domain-containing proteins [Roseburia intestinalis M50/1]